MSTELFVVICCAVIVFCAGWLIGWRYAWSEAGDLIRKIQEDKEK